MKVNRNWSCLKIRARFRLHFRAGGLCKSKGANYYEIGSVKITFNGKQLTSGWRASLKNLKEMNRFCYLLLLFLLLLLLLLLLSLLLLLLLLL